MSPTLRNQAKLAAVALAAGLALTAFGSGDARAAFNVKDFSCTDDPFGVTVDVSGLGGTNVCVEGSVEVDLNCACVGGGNNCPNDAKKQTTPATVEAAEAVEPKNGRVTTTFTLPVALNDGLCTTEDPALTCPGGQDAKLISFETAGADFTLCTTTEPAGEDCTCVGQTPLAETTCGPTSDIVFPGKRGSCAALFP
jgi:hypothetical protein